MGVLGINAMIQATVGSKRGKSCDRALQPSVPNLTFLEVLPPLCPPAMAEFAAEAYLNFDGFSNSSQDPAAHFWNEFTRSLSPSAASEDVELQRGGPPRKKQRTSLGSRWLAFEDANLDDYAPLATIDFHIVGL
jgi:hypothetical protein